MDDAPHAPEGPALPLWLAAELQDHLMTVDHDLHRLQDLLAHACETLMQGFHGAREAMAASHQDAPGAEQAALERAAGHLGEAVVALQFQDMTSQLIEHTRRRLRRCADQVARHTFGDDDEGTAVVEAAPQRPNPVTQAQMHAGSIELF